MSGIVNSFKFSAGFAFLGAFAGTSPLSDSLDSPLSLYINSLLALELIVSLSSAISLNSWAILGKSAKI